jgi:hypothetical protein
MSGIAKIIVLAVVFSYTSHGQGFGQQRFLFEPVFRPYDWRPQTDFNATRSVGSFHPSDTRITPNQHGNAASFGNNPRDFNATVDTIDGSPTSGTVGSMTIGNPNNNLANRWNTDTSFNPNLTLSGTLTGRNFTFESAPQMSMDHVLNGNRGYGETSMGRSDVLRSSLNWSTTGIDLPFDFLNGRHDLQIERADSIDMGAYFQDGQAITGSNDETFFQCGGHQVGNVIHFHWWEKRHFASLSRVGLDAKRSIPLDGIYAYIDANDEHSWRQNGNLDLSYHWDRDYGNMADKPIFNVGWGIYSASGPVLLSTCIHYTGRYNNERYTPGGLYHPTVDSTATGAANDPIGSSSSNGGLGTAGHPDELHNSSLSPWAREFGYDLSRFFGDFMVQPGLWENNNNDSPTAGTGVLVDRVAGDPNFMNPIFRENLVSTRNMSNALEFGDFRRKLRIINRFPLIDVDYLVQNANGDTLQ